MSNEQQIDNLVELLDGYSEKGGHHLNVNVFDREMLLDAQQHLKISTVDRSCIRLCRALQQN